MRIRSPGFTLLVAAAALSRGCDRPPPEPPRVETVMALNLPLETFARRMAEGVIAVERPIPEGEDPLDWMPPAEAIARVQSAALILSGGPGASPWGEAVPLPAARTIDSTANARSRFPPERQGVRHRHGGGAEHSHGASAAQAWLDLGLARLQARAVRDGLVRVRPESEATIDARWRELDAELSTLHGEFAAVLAEAPALVASHPSYDFLAHAYDLDLGSVHWEPEDLPDDAAFAELAALAASRGASFMLWEAPPRPEVALRLATLGIVPVVVEPAGAADGSRDFLAVMRSNLANLRAALRPTEPGGSR